MEQEIDCRLNGNYSQGGNYAELVIVIVVVVVILVFTCPPTTCVPPGLVEVS